MATFEANSLLRFKDEQGNTILVYPITKAENVDGLPEKLFDIVSEAGNKIVCTMDPKTFVVSISLQNSEGKILSTDSFDLPLESVVVGGNYDSKEKKVVLTLQNGQEIRFPVADLVDGLVKLSDLKKLAFKDQAETEDIADKSITREKLVDGAVTQEDIGLLTEVKFIPAGKTITFNEQVILPAAGMTIKMAGNIGPVEITSLGLYASSGLVMGFHSGGSPYTLFQNNEWSAYYGRRFTLTADYTFESEEIKQWLINNSDLVVVQYHYVRSINGQSGDVVLGVKYQHNLRFLTGSIQGTSDQTFVQCQILADCKEPFEDTASVVEWLESKGFDYMNTPHFTVSGIVPSAGDKCQPYYAFIDYAGVNTFCIAYWSISKQLVDFVRNPELVDDFVL